MDGSIDIYDSVVSGDIYDESVVTILNPVTEYISGKRRKSRILKNPRTLCIRPDNSPLFSGVLCHHILSLVKQYGSLRHLTLQSSLLSYPSKIYKEL